MITCKMVLAYSNSQKGLFYSNNKIQAKSGSCSSSRVQTQMQGPYSHCNVSPTVELLAITNADWQRKAVTLLAGLCQIVLPTVDNLRNFLRTRPTEMLLTHNIGVDR